MRAPDFIIFCQVIDNFGDAGFSLRLGTRLNAIGYQVVLLHDNHQAFSRLLGSTPHPNLECIEFSQVKSIPLDRALGVLQPFGTSDLNPEALLAESFLRSNLHERPWIIIDYLSAENWVESFHGLKSIDPKTGHCKTYCYPGFTANTGGLIYSDAPPLPPSVSPKTPKKFTKIFCFPYSTAPMVELACALQEEQEVYSPQLGVEHPAWHLLEFVPQAKFDELISRFDFLFIRGEDSFARAQLLGKPFVWQIYPTPDGAHVDKLKAFFNLYSEELPNDAKYALWQLWLAWNNIQVNPSFTPSFTRCWLNIEQHVEILRDHAYCWAKKLRQGNELVGEILRLSEISAEPLR